MSTGSGVFVLRDAATLVPMQVASFASEDDFQRLLASFPELLAGDQIDPEVPRRFVLVAREHGIAFEEGGGDRWSIDHLFLDQDGIPTLVEVKRGSDTRIRREVVGQMLDYAANAVLHWPVEELRARMHAACEAEGRDVQAVLAGLIGAEADEEAFWAGVATNLQAGRIRLLFVADRVPPELRRVVEFLNRQMRPAEVLAIELRQFEGQGLKTLVPLVLGQTQESAGKGPGRPVLPRRVWDEVAILGYIAARGDPAAAAVAEALVTWIREHADAVRFGPNPQWGWIAPAFIRGGIEYQPFRIWTDGTLAIPFQYLLDKPVFGDVAMRRALMERLNGIEGAALQEAMLLKRPHIPLVRLAAPGAMAVLRETMTWFVRRVGRGPARAFTRVRCHPIRGKAA